MIINQIKQTTNKSQLCLSEYLNYFFIYYTFKKKKSAFSPQHGRASFVEHSFWVLEIVNDLQVYKVLCESEVWLGMELELRKEKQEWLEQQQTLLENHLTSTGKTKEAVEACRYRLNYHYEFVFESILDIILLWT